MSDGEMRLKDCVSRHVGGGTPSKKVPFYWNGSIKWASVKDISNTDKYLNTTEDKITEDGLSASSSNLVSNGSLIVGMRMSVGKFVLPTGPVAINQDLRALYPKDHVDCGFLYYACTSAAEQLNSFAVGSTVKGISVEDLLNLRLFVPPLPEQRRIAEILSTVDEQISTEISSIEKNQKIKTGLLSHFFNKATNTICLAEACDIFYGESPKNILDPEGSNYVYGTGGVVGKTFSFLYEGEAVVIPRKGSLDNPMFVNKRFWTIDTTFYAIPKLGFDAKWIYYGLINFGLMALNEATGVPSINRDRLSRIGLPKMLLDEQQHVRQVITGIDEKISFHFDTLTKLNKLKASLMSDLLTGKVRVTC